MIHSEGISASWSLYSSEVWERDENWSANDVSTFNPTFFWMSVSKSIVVSELWVWIDIKRTEIMPSLILISIAQSIGIMNYHPHLWFSNYLELGLYNRSEKEYLVKTERQCLHEDQWRWVECVQFEPILYLIKQIYDNCSIESIELLND